MSKKANKLRMKIKSYLLVKLAFARSEIRRLNNKNSKLTKENQELIDEMEPLRIRIRELTLKVKEYEKQNV